MNFKVLIFTLALFTCGYSAEYLLVVAKTSPLNSIDLEDLKRLYLGKSIKVQGNNLKVINQDIHKEIGESFLEDIVQMDARSYLKWWIKQQIIGRGFPPSVKLTDQEVISELLKSELTVGYISPSKLTPELKALVVHR